MQRHTGSTKEHTLIGAKKTDRSFGSWRQSYAQGPKQITPPHHPFDLLHLERSRTGSVENYRLRVSSSFTDTSWALYNCIHIVVPRGHELGDGMDRDGGSGGNEGGGVVGVVDGGFWIVDAFLRSHSTSASGGHGIWSWGRMGNHAPMVSQWRGGGYNKLCFPQVGKKAFVGLTVLEAAGAKCSPPPSSVLIISSHLILSLAYPQIFSAIRLK
ncbi:hypothetical protein Tco_0162467 [Tanacetum coccineum]